MDELDSKLIEAAGEHNLMKTITLLNLGANPNNSKSFNLIPQYRNQKNETTALYQAISSKFQDQFKLVDVVQVLLKHGADCHYQAYRGRSVTHELFKTLALFKQTKEKIRLIKAFLEAGFNLNQSNIKGNMKPWKIYSFHSSFIMEFMKIQQICNREFLLKKSNFNVHQARHKKHQSLKIQFKQSQQIEGQQKNSGRLLQQVGSIKSHKQNDCSEKRLSLQNSVNFIIELIKLGADVNGFSYYQEWEKNPDQNNEIRIIRHQTALHRAIMNNSLDLVKILISHGAETSVNYRYTQQKPILPHSWPLKLKIKKKQVNQKCLITAKRKLLYLLNNQNIHNIQEHQKRIEAAKFKVYELNKYTVENGVPITECTQCELTCLQLAQKLNVCPEIIAFLKNNQKFL